MQRFFLATYRFLINHWMGSIMVAGIAALLFRLFFIQTFTVMDQSMAPLVIPGDKVITNRFTPSFRGSSWSPRAWQLIVFKHPLVARTQTMKRIIAAPGDSVEIRDQKLFVNQTEIKILEKQEVPGHTPGWFLWNDLPTLKVPEQGDELSLSEVPPRDFDFRVNLLKQIKPEASYNIQCLFYKDEMPMDPQFIMDLLKEIPNWTDKKFPSEQPWYILIQIKHFLSLQYPNSKISFKRNLFKNGAVVEKIKILEPCYFVIGDNISESYDSRFWGYISQSSIISTPFLIGWNVEPNSWIKINFSRVLKWIG